MGWSNTKFLRIQSLKKYNFEFNLFSKYITIFKYFNSASFRERLLGADSKICLAKFNCAGRFFDMYAKPQIIQSC